MRQEAEFFGDRPMALVFIGKRLDESLAVEKLLEPIDYAVEVDYYTGGVIFRRERAGAFFYVEEHDYARAAELLRVNGYYPQVPEPAPAAPPRELE